MNGLELRVSLGSCGVASGAQHTLESLTQAAEGIGCGHLIKSVGCNGMCYRAPMVEVVEDSAEPVLYGNVSPGIAPLILTAHGALQRLKRIGRRIAPDFFRLRASRARRSLAPLRIDLQAGGDAVFRVKQTPVVLENCGQIDPLCIEDYLARNGYQALRHCLEALTPQQVIDIIARSGLRGRGGAGFPTGQKWTLCREQPVQPKYVICNGDEGDPGAFMDRLVLESDPHRVLEGLAIAAYAVGAAQGFFYVRAEYPHAVAHLRVALAQAREHGFLGPSVLGTDFSLELALCTGAGAFVCGEETALIASLEGRRGTPRLRPPFPVARGLHERPTTVNNVETLACVPWIIRRGPEPFAAMGTERSKGTKVFALAGKVRRGGLIEVPMGITIREIVADIGGGIKNDRGFKAVQMGGPSGGCVPARLADTRIDYDELSKAGAIMGSGGMVVLDDHDCMVDVARFFLRFTQNESCGKCTFCRIGTKRMLEILDRICEGNPRPDDLDNLETLARQVKRASLCGLGQTAPNPVLSTLEHFRDEYEVHFHERRCPAGKCPQLIHYRINDRCIGCTLCAQVCPTSAIEYRPYETHAVRDERCTRCGMCLTVCQDNAVEVI